MNCEVFLLKRQLQMANEKLRQLDEDKKRMWDELQSKKEPLIIPQNTLYRNTQWGNNLIVNTKSEAMQIHTNTQWGSNLIVNLRDADGDKIFDELSNLIFSDKRSVEYYDRYDWDKVIIRGGP